MTDREGIIVSIRATIPRVWIFVHCDSCRTGASGHPRRGENEQEAVDRLLDQLYASAKYACRHNVKEVIRLARHEGSMSTSAPSAPPLAEPGPQSAGRAKPGASLGSGPYQPAPAEKENQ